MKCIRMHGSPHIKRVQDNVALILVSDGKAVYVCKEEWKKQTRPAKDKV